MDVPAADGVPLSVEIDGQGPVTVVLAHGWTLDATTWVPVARSLDARVVRYDHRGHGRSAAVDPASMTIDQLADDLAAVIAAVAPEGPLVLAGHSMGGMAIMAFAERHPEVFGSRVAGAALVSTTAGGLKTHHIVSRLIPDSIGNEIGARLIAGLALAPDLVDRVRRRGSNVGFLVADQFAFGEDVPAAYVELVDNMLAATSFEVLAQFFPNFDSLDKYTVLATFARVPTYVITGTRDMLTSTGLSRTMASRIPGAVLVECPGAGHMVILEQNDRVNSALDDLLSAAGAPVSSGASRVS
jgi:pimeloyl-ACP methyl ester carboxylesterase